jgi:hypothetical protein
MFNLRGPQGQNPRTTVWETLVHTFQNFCQARTGHNVVKSSSPNAPSTWPIFLCPPSLRFPPPLATSLLVAFSLVTLVATVLQCTCSESPCLSIKRYRINVCYTNITLYLKESPASCSQVQMTWTPEYRCFVATRQCSAPYCLFNCCNNPRSVLRVSSTSAVLARPRLRWFSCLWTTQTGVGRQVF